MKNNHGFTLVEVLVAVLILSTALLGLVGLQTAGVKNTISSYNRTQATQLAYNMADRIRANRVEGLKGAASSYVTITPASVSASRTNCTAAATGVTMPPACTSVQMATNDLYEWNQELIDTTRGLAKTATITYTDPVFSITVSWGEGRDDNKDGTIDSNLSFRTDFQL